MIHDEDERFGGLRALLQRPYRDEAWQRALMALLVDAHRLQGPAYHDRWLPYLASFASTLPSPLATASSLAELEAFVGAAPFARFALLMQSELEEGVFASTLMEHVSALKLEWVSLSADVFDALRTADFLPNLSSLQLIENGIGDREVRLFASTPAIAGLRTLEFDRNDIGWEGARALADSDHLGDLSHLAFGSCPIDVSVPALLESPKLSGLRHLSLRFIRLDDRTMSTIFHRIPALARITGLDLVGAGLNGNGVATLARSPHLSGLASLDLEYNEIQWVGARALARSETLRALRTLELGRGVIGDLGAKWLSQAEDMPELEALSLYSNALGEQGLEHLAQASVLSKVSTLNLRYNHYGLSGLRALFGSPYIGALRHLDIRGGGLSSRDLETLSHEPIMGQLRTLHVHSDDFSAQTMASFTRWPGLVVS